MGATNDMNGDQTESPWVAAAPEAELAEGALRLVCPAGVEVCLVRQDGEVFAVGAWCSHARASLAEGDLMPGAIMCPLHGARFDLRTGRHFGLPAVRGIPVYPVKVENGTIWVRV